MANVSSLLSWLLVYSIYLVLGDCSELSKEECRHLGFTPNLSCESCRLLSDYNLHALIDDCKKCCQEDSSGDALKGDKPNQFPGLEIKYVRGADPEIVLLDENKNAVETLGIEKWNTDSVDQFFHERLKK